MTYYFKPTQELPEPAVVGETKDGSGSADHDIPFTFGSPRGFLTTRNLANLIIMRGFVMDIRRGEPDSALDGSNAAKGDITPDF